MSLTRRDDYDAAGRRVRQRHLAVEAADRTLETGYWPNGAVKRQRMADGTWTGLYGYDGFGRLASLDNAVPASAAEPDFFVTAIAYNARGQTETIAYGNGMTATYSYSLQRGWLDRVVVQKAAATLLDQTYSRTPDGLIAAIASPDPARAWTYGYDGLGRLVLADRAAGSAEDRSFAYDGADNLVFNSGLCAANPNLVYPDGNGAAPGQGLSARRPHAPTAICGSPVTYDAAGNTLAYDPDGAGPLAPRSLIYDAAGRPLAVTAAGAAARFVYGPDGERVRKSAGSAQRPRSPRPGSRCLAAPARSRRGEAPPELRIERASHPDVRRDGALTAWAVKDHLASNRLLAFMGAVPATRHDLSGAGPVASRQLPRVRGAAKLHRSFASSAPLTRSASP